MGNRESKGKEAERKQEPFRNKWPTAQRPLLYKHKYRAVSGSGKSSQGGETSKNRDKLQQKSGNDGRVIQDGAGCASGLESRVTRRIDSSSTSAGATVGPVSSTEQLRRDKQKTKLDRADEKSSNESLIGPEVVQRELW